MHHFFSYIFVKTGNNSKIWVDVVGKSGKFKEKMANQYSIEMKAASAAELQRRLQRDGGFVAAEKEYTQFCYEGEGVHVAYYAKRGKLVVQGRKAEEFVNRYAGGAAEPPQGSAAASTATGVDESPHFGVDESGKGDYFGPLVVAGVYTDADSAAALHKLGCRDSKTIPSDAQIARIAAGIRSTPGVVWEVLCIGPRRYNEMYADMGNLNRLLAWGHARVIAALHAKKPSCPRALSDQFANEWVLRRALGARKVPVKLEQRPRAEQDVAVAAASILARARFVEWMHQAATAAECELPLGCAPHVTKAARAFLKKHGAERLGDIAKLHFKITKQVL